MQVGMARKRKADKGTVGMSTDMVAEAGVDTDTDTGTGTGTGEVAHGRKARGGTQAESPSLLALRRRRNGKQNKRRNAPRSV